MNDCLVIYIKRDIACSIDNETIIHWKKIKTHKKTIVNFMYLRIFFIDVVINILISLFIRLHNLYFLRNTLRKILETANKDNNNNNNNKQCEPMFFWTLMWANVAKVVMKNMHVSPIASGIDQWLVGWV